MAYIIQAVVAAEWDFPQTCVVKSEALPTILLILVPLLLLLAPQTQPSLSPTVLHSRFSLLNSLDLGSILILFLQP